MAAYASPNANTEERTQCKSPTQVAETNANQFRCTTPHNHEGYPQDFNMWTMTPEISNPNPPIPVTAQTPPNQVNPSEARGAQPSTGNQSTPHIHGNNVYPPQFVTDLNNKLDYVISQVTKIDQLEQQFANMNNDLSLIKRQQSAFESSLNFLSDKFDEQIVVSSGINDKITDLERESQRLRSECKSLYVTVTDLQSRSMRDNLLFTGI